MRISFSEDLTEKYGEPMWWVHEDDRKVSYEFPLSRLKHSLDPPECDQHFIVAKNTLIGHLGKMAAEAEEQNRRELADRETHLPTHVQWLLAEVALAIDEAKPRDRSPKDRHYAILSTDVDKALSWAASKRL